MTRQVITNSVTVGGAKISMSGFLPEILEVLSLIRQDELHVCNLTLKSEDRYHALLTDSSQGLAFSIVEDEGIETVTVDDGSFQTDESVLEAVSNALFDIQCAV